MTDRGPVTRCAEKACPFVGHFAAYGDRCPEHRDRPVSRPPSIVEEWLTRTSAASSALPDPQETP